MHPLLLSLLLIAPVEDAKVTAQAVLDKGARLFEARDAKGLVDTYVRDALVVIESWDAEGGHATDEQHRGRAAIEALYQKTFENKQAFTAKNSVEFAKFIGKDYLVIQGRFQPDIANELAVDFVQIRVKEGGRWQLKELRLLLSKAD